MSTPHSNAVLWPQFILAATLDRLGRETRKGDEAFSYVDTHAGSGHLIAPQPHLSRLRDHRHDFLSQTFFNATDAILAKRDYPGSWVLAAQVLKDADVDFDIDINDLSTEAVEQARQNREIARIRYWSDDWFRFLSTRLKGPRPPHFVFIDPPHDAPGATYAMDAAILLDTIRVPYMLTYSVPANDEVINLIGRSVLELTWGHSPHGPQHCSGVLLGGGAERMLLPLLSDLGQLAHHLEGRYAFRTPDNNDFII